LDKQGRTADFLLSERRDMEAAKRFFRKSDEEPPDTARHHLGRLRGFTSSHQPIEISPERCRIAFEYDPAST
jgi:hypothetical protein